MVNIEVYYADNWQVYRVFRYPWGMVPPASRATYLPPQFHCGVARGQGSTPPHALSMNQPPAAGCQPANFFKIKIGVSYDAITFQNGKNIQQILRGYLNIYAFLKNRL